MTSEPRYELWPDYAIGQPEREALRALLAACFPGYFDNRTFFKQVPVARFLVHDGARLVAQVGIEDRVIRLGESPVRIFGVVDLCVTAALRTQGIGSQLLASVEQLARQHGVEFLVLFADEQGFYRRKGYRTVANTTRWLAIEDLRSEVILERSLANCFMVKQIGEQPWDDEVPVDLLGYLF